MGTLTVLSSGLGSVLAGLPGAIFGAVAGSTLDTLLPDVGANILGELGADGVTVLVGQFAQRMAGPDAPLVNHDLQRVFRHAVMLSLEDIGGPTTFAASARSPRLAPDPAVVYPFAAHDDLKLVEARACSTWN